MKYNIDSIIQQLVTNYFQLSKECITELKKRTQIQYIESPTTLIKEGQYTNHIYYIISDFHKKYNVSQKCS